MNSIFNISNKLLTNASKKWFPLYLEHCKVTQNNFGILVLHEDGSKTQVPVGVCSVLILGPGTSITHGAINICSQCNCLINWTGENCSSYYAMSHESTSSNKNAMKQIILRCNRSTRLEVIKRMFHIRYPGIDVNTLNIKNMMGVEGAKVKETYRLLSQKYRVKWVGRRYGKYNNGVQDDINISISCGNSILYSLVFSSVISMGFLPSIGFIHKGSMRDFVLDISDIFKKEIVLEAAFESISRCNGFNKKDLTQKIYRNLEELKFMNKITVALQNIIWEEKY